MALSQNWTAVNRSLSQSWSSVSRVLGSLNVWTKGDLIDQKISVEDFKSMTVGDIKGVTKTSLWKKVSRSGLSQSWSAVAR